MVARILERIGAQVSELVMRPVRNLHQAAYLLAGLTLASQLLALLRDRTFAHIFGAGQVLDLYYAAFRVPDLVFALVASLVSAYVLIPRLTTFDREKTRELLSESASFLFFVGGGLCLLLAAFMPHMLGFLFPDFSSSPLYDEFVLLARLLLIQPILLGLSGVLGSVTQVNRRFVLFALSPVLYNLGIIFGALLLYPVWGLAGIGVGVIFGSIAYIAVNVPVVIEAGVLPRFVWPNVGSMMSIMRDSVPRSLALGVGSITMLVLTAIAARIGTGAISVFTFASNLAAVPLGLIGSSYAVAAFPALSAAAGPDKRSEFSSILSASARHIILWSVVATGLIIVLRAHLVRVVLGTGAFDWDATRMTAALLAILAVGLSAQGLTLLFSRALYAAKQSWRPLFYQLAGGALTILFALFLLGAPDGLSEWVARNLKVAGLAGADILLVAGAATLGQIALALLSLYALHSVTPRLARTLGQSLIDGAIAAFAGGAATYLALAFFGEIAPLTTLAAVFLEGFAAGIIGLIAAASALYFIENEEFRIVASSLKRLIGVRGRAVLAPSADETPPVH